MRAARALLVALVAALALPSAASATVYTVTTTADHEDKFCDADCSLRDAVNAAGAGDSITLPAGNYVLSSGELSLNRDTITGAGARTTSISGGGASRVLYVGGDSGASNVSGVTITGGNGSGGVNSGQGGGIYVTVGAALVMTNSTVAGNTARAGGGVVTHGTFTLVGGTISGNVATSLRASAGTGGGVSVQNTGLAQLGNVTVSGNTARNGTLSSGAGGGIYTLGRTNLINITVASNTASDGSALWQAASTATGGPTVQTSLTNSILAATTGAACAGPGVAAPSAITSHHNVVSDGSCQLTGEGERQDANPQLGALANNGGQTDTHALAFNSAAINSGGTGCAGSDQRGIARPQGGTCDSGAYEYRAPQLTVVTGVVNDAGGTRGPADFTVHVREGGGDVKGSPQLGSATGTAYVLDAGKTYVVGADALAGYTRAIGGDCDGKGAITLAEGQNRTCNVTANDIDPTLKVVTTVTNNNGGTLKPSDISAHVRLPSGGEAAGSPQPGSTTGTTYILGVGTHTVSANPVTGYTITIGGNCAANGTVSLALAEAKKCTITADDVAPTLRVITQVTNDDGGSNEPEDFSTHVRSGTQDVAGSPKPGTPDGTVYTLAAGTYGVSAEGVSGYSSSVGGDCALNGTITVKVGDAKQCTITADDGASTLTVITNVINDNGGTRTPASLSVHVRDGDTDLTGSPQAGDPSGTSYGVPADTYTVAAAPTPGYTMAVSGDCTAGGTVTVGLDESKTCTVTANDVAPTLKVITTVVNDSGGTRTPSGFTIHVRKGGADVANSPKPGSASGTSYTLSAGTYAVGSDAVTGYTTAIGGACAANGAVTLQPGDVKTCTVKGSDSTVVRRQQLPPPQPGKNVNALPSSGVVKKKLPGSSAFVPLDEGEQIPLGTIVDVRKGRVTIVAAAGDGQTADFYGGIFKLGQTKGAKPITVLTLVEKLSCPKKKATAAAKKKKKRRLWGDGKGRFRTKGKHSAATVVGTKWLVEDKCTSTLTRVVRGKVRVRDFVKKKTVLVKAGKRYVARARR